jgi:hypothetical protein
LAALARQQLSVLHPAAYAGSSTDAMSIRVTSFIAEDALVTS